MKTELSDEAAEYGRTAQRAIESAGGDELVQAAEREPDRREKLVAPVLAELGAWELDPRDSADELEAAAALCRAAGWWSVPYPVAERLARPIDLDVDGSIVVSEVGPAGPVAGLDLRWTALGLDGRRYAATPRPASEPPRRSAFVTGLDLEPVDGAGDGSADVALGLVLSDWTLLGSLDRALALTRAYVLEREQFGQPLARFQSVQFQLTDAEVERVGVEELAKYALWSIAVGLDEALDDALALRLAAIEAAETVFRVTHQLHGALGFCDETTLSWVSRYSQPRRRLPLGRSATQDLLTRRLGRRGLTGPFSEVR
ncbi:MAG: acyl-CoA dehydrogenase family protein [Frankia sp.]